MQCPSQSSVMPFERLVTHRWMYYFVPRSGHPMQQSGAFIGTRVKGAVGACETLPSNCSMDDVSFEVNAFGWHITLVLSIGQIGGASHGKPRVSSRSTTNSTDFDPNQVETNFIGCFWSHSASSDRWCFCGNCNLDSCTTWALHIGCVHYPATLWA